MTSATDISVTDAKPGINKTKKVRSAFDSSLILGIALIAVFLCLFVLEFSRILSITGRVDHTPAVPVPVTETANAWHPST